MDNDVTLKQACPNGVIYTVRAGDTLFSIANQYNVTVDAILRANPGLDPDSLRVGQRICIPGVQSRCPAGSFEYTIRAGDTIFQLARRFNTTVDAILDINPGLDPTNLRVGQVICIPRESTPGKCPAGSFEYTVRAGDTIFQLARRFNTSVQAILDINPGLDPNNLRVGQVICIPGMMPGKCPAGSFEYTVRAGDTIFQIARRFNTTVQAILNINPGLDPDNLRVGQVICIPGMMPGRCPAGSFEYTVRAGDTLFQIARRFNTTVQAILDINPGLDPDNLRVGQVICIPGMMPGKCPAGSFEYTVRAGDTIPQLARRFNTTVQAILDINPGLDPDNLRVGQVICIPGMMPGRCPAGSFEYTVRAGDTIFQIARRFNTTVQAILNINPGLDPDNLRVGQVICIPGMMPGRCPAGSFEYTVRAGDTIFQIARRFNTTVQAILNINPGLDPDNLRVGQVICIPGMMPGKCPAGSFEYTVRAGDTIPQLARRFNTTVQAILNINPGLDPDNLRVGQVICIPGEPVPGKCPLGSFEYTIRAGDTYFILAQRFGVSVDDIIAANPGVDPNRLQIGQVICIPQAEVPPCPGGTIYVIRPGDTLFLIAQRNNISLDKLIAANPQITNPDRLIVGTSICIPAGRTLTRQACPTGTFAYTVRAGDTYFRLAQQFNTTVEAITRANPGVDPNALQIGQRICIPGTAPPPAGCPTGTFAYTVRAGDTYFRLAQQFNTTVEAITRANPGVDPNALQVGQRICIPGTAPPPPAGCPAGTFEYTVRSGDTYFRLAQQFNTTVEAITRANPGVNPNALQIGQKICIPGTAPPPPTGCPAGTFEYTVRSGDTYFRLAQQFNTTVEAITRANPGVNPNALQIGQKICIPRT